MASKPYRQQKKTMKFGSKPENRPRNQNGGLGLRKSADRSAEVDRRVVEDRDPDDNICCVCVDDIHIFAKGSCDHVICFKCSSRMRVLCEENYCAVCRMDLQQVGLFYEQFRAIVLFS